MSEQLETIKCSDWAINSSWAAGGGADRQGARLYRQPALHCFFSPFFLILRGAPGRSRSNPSVSARLQPQHQPDFYLLNITPRRTRGHWLSEHAGPCCRFARFSGICGAAQQFRCIRSCNMCEGLRERGLVEGLMTLSI